jgi:hypothetical protein
LAIESLVRAGATPQRVALRGPASFCWHSKPWPAMRIVLSISDFYKKLMIHPAAALRFTS